MRWYDPLLYPFALLYDLVTCVRNWMFDTGLKRSFNFKVPVVVVGNLNLGGSGKTPMVEYLIECFQDKFEIATLSRGYGRKTRGFLLADQDMGPNELGDEPFQIFTKYGKNVTVSVGEKRVPAILEILRLRPKTNLLLLDDAFQHRYVKGDFYVLLTTYQKPFYRDNVLPLGTLREHPSGAKRADIVIVTKCPLDVSHEEKESMKTQIQRFTKAEVVFAGIQYGQPIAVNPKFPEVRKDVVLVSGIANDRLFAEEVQKHFNMLHRLSFPDHYRYKLSDIQKMRELLLESSSAMILTTEKDAVKLKNEAFSKYLEDFPIFVLPIKVKLEQDKSQYLDARINKIIKDKAYISES